MGCPTSQASGCAQGCAIPTRPPTAPSQSKSVHSAQILPPRSARALYHPSLPSIGTQYRDLEVHGL